MTIETATTDNSNAPVRVATRDEILSSPSELLLTTDMIKATEENARADWVYITTTDGVLNIENMPRTTDLHYRNVGYSFIDGEGRTTTLLGVYVVHGVAGRLVFLSLLSDRNCTVYGWCRGHEDGSRDTERHSGELIEAFEFEGGTDREPARVVVTPFIEADTAFWAVAIEYDQELDKAGVYTLANELEAVAAQLRGIK